MGQMKNEVYDIIEATINLVQPYLESVANTKNQDEALENADILIHHAGLAFNNYDWLDNYTEIEPIIHLLKTYHNLKTTNEIGVAIGNTQLKYERMINEDRIVDDNEAFGIIDIEQRYNQLIRSLQRELVFFKNGNKEALEEQIDYVNRMREVLIGLMSIDENKPF